MHLSRGEPRKHHAIDVFFFLTGQAAFIRTALLYGSLFQGYVEPGNLRAIPATKENILELHALYRAQHLFTTLIAEQPCATGGNVLLDLGFDQDIVSLVLELWEFSDATPVLDCFRTIPIANYERLQQLSHPAVELLLSWQSFNVLAEARRGASAFYGQAYCTLFFAALQLTLSG